MERLQKIIARAGLASRRKAEELIRLGYVKVNGVIVTELGAKAELGKDDIRVRGRALHVARPEVWILHKPADVICGPAAEDDASMSVMQLIPKKLQRLGVLPVGRLDKDAQGLLLLTNDRELAFRILSPNFRVVLTYRIKMRGRLKPKSLRLFEKGVIVPEVGRMPPARVRVVEELDQSSWVDIEVIETKSRLLRKACEHLGHQVSKMKRTGLGPLTMGSLKPGMVRPLREDEIERLYKSVELISKKSS